MVGVGSVWVATISAIENSSLSAGFFGGEGDSEEGDEEDEL